MAAMSRDSTVVAAVVRTRPRSILLAMITMRKSIHGFPSISIYGMLMGLRLVALRAAGAPLKIVKSAYLFLLCVYNLRFQLTVTCFGKPAIPHPGPALILEKYTNRYSILS